MTWDSGNPNVIAHATKSTVNWTLPSQQACGKQQQANKAKTSFQNEQEEIALITKPTADVLSSAVYCLEQQLFFGYIILNILLNWLAFPCLTAGVLAQFVQLGNVKQNHVFCILHAKWTFVCRKWSAARYWGGIAHDQKGFHCSRLGERRLMEI